MYISWTIMNFDGEELEYIWTHDTMIHRGSYWQMIVTIHYGLVLCSYAMIVQVGCVCIIYDNDW